MYVGVDTHKQAHVLVVLDEDGRSGGSRTIANAPEGWAAALEWVRGQQQQQHTRTPPHDLLYTCFTGCWQKTMPLDARFSCTDDETRGGSRQ